MADEMAHDTGSVLTRKIGGVPVVVYGAIAVLAVVAVVYFRRKRSAVASSTVADQMASSGDGTAVAGDGGGGASYGAATGDGGSTVTTSGSGTGIQTDQQWATRVINAMIGASTQWSATDINNAVTNYLSGASLDSTGQAIVNYAITNYGPPPEGTLPVIPLVTDSSTTSTSTPPPPTPVTPTPQPASSSTPASTGKITFVWYTVKKGDTFQSIAKSFYGNDSAQSIALVQNSNNGKGIYWHGMHAAGGPNYDGYPEGKYKSLNPGSRVAVPVWSQS